MKYLSIIIFIAFIGLSVFGVFGMHAMMQNNSEGCIAASIQSTDCPNQINSFDYLVFHINAYQSFSLAIFGESIISVLLFTLILSIFYQFFLLLKRFIGSQQLSLYKYRFRNFSFYSQKQKINQWLAMHENSPAVYS